MADTPFIGLPDDLARLAVQRLMTCDCRRRAYDRASRVWQRTATSLAALAAVGASLAAVSVVQNFKWLAIFLSVFVAVLVPLQNSLGSAGRSADNREAATKFEFLSHEFERFTQLDLGPPTWLGRFENPDQLRRKLEEIDNRASQSTNLAPRVKFRSDELKATEARARHLIEYLSMPNVIIPEQAVWAN